MKVVDSFIIQFLEDHYKEGRIINGVSYFYLEDTNRAVAATTWNYLLRRNAASVIEVSATAIDSWFYLFDNKIYDDVQMKKFMKLKAFL